PEQRSDETARRSRSSPLQLRPKAVGATTGNVASHRRLNGAARRVVSEGGQASTIRPNPWRAVIAWQPSMAETQADRPSPLAPDAERRLARALLGLIVLLFFAFAALYVRR